MRFVLFTAVKISMLVFWVITPSGLAGKYFSPKDGCNILPRNIGVYV
jgi:hypothetical protein